MRIALIGLFAAALLSGCAKDGGLLARVGGREISVNDFLAAARSAQDQYPGPPDSAKAMLLDDLIHRQLMLRHAEDLGWYRDTLISHFRGVKEKELLSEALHRQIAPRNIPVSDAEVEQLYAWRDSSAHMQAIYCFTRALAQGAFDEVQRTGDFAAVANKFNPTGLLPPGGDLGDQSSGNLVEPLDQLLRTAPIGKLIGPLEVPGQGWFVVRVTRRSKRPQVPIDAQRPLLAEMIRQRKQRTVLIQNQQKMRAQYQLRLVPGGSQALFAHMAGGPNTPAQLPPQLGAQPLARWHTPEGDRVFTLQDAIHALLTGEGERPNPNVLPSIEEWILLQCSNQIEATEARRRMIAEDPEWNRELDQAVNGYVLDAYYQEEVAARATQEPDDARLAYERNRQRYDRLESAKLLVVTFPDSAGAARFTTHAAHAGDLRKAAAMAPGSPPVEELDVTFSPPSMEWAQYRNTLLQMQPGNGYGPFRLRTGEWRIFQLESKVQIQPDLANLEPEQRNLLQQQTLEVARERRLSEVIRQLQTSFPTEVHREKLKRLPWPVPPLAGS